MSEGKLFYLFPHNAVPSSDFGKLFPTRSASTCSNELNPDSSKTPDVKVPIKGKLQGLMKVVLFQKRK